MISSVGIAELFTLAVHQNSAVVTAKDETLAVRLNALDVETFAWTFLEHQFVVTIFKHKNLALIRAHQQLSSRHPNVASVVLTDLRLLFGDRTVNNLHLVVGNSHVLITAETCDQELVMVGVVERHLHRVERRGCTRDLLLVVETDTIPSPDDDLDVRFTCQGSDELLLLNWCECNG